MVAKRRLDRCHIWIRYMDAVGQRTEDMLRLLQRRQRARAESFVFGLQLLEHVQSRTFPGLLLECLILLTSGPFQLMLDLAQTLLALAHGSALSLGVQL